MKMPTEGLKEAIAARAPQRTGRPDRRPHHARHSRATVSSVVCPMIALLAVAGEASASAATAQGRSRCRAGAPGPSTRRRAAAKRKAASATADAALIPRIASLAG
jgi:hypothetical protein